MKGHIAAISPFMRPLIGTDIAFKSISISKYFALCVVEGQLCSCYMSQWLTVEWIGFQIVIKQSTLSSGPLCRYGIALCLIRNVLFTCQGVGCYSSKTSKKSNLLWGKWVVDDANDPSGQIATLLKCTAFTLHAFYMVTGSKSTAFLVV